MKFFKTEGIVIREANSGEADKVLTILSSSYGKITVFAKGARRTKSRFLSNAQFLAFSEFVLVKSKDMFSISSAQLKSSFFELRSDIDRLVYASYICEILNDVIVENQSDKGIIKLTLITLYKLNSDEFDSNLIIRSFELRLLSILGYMPNVNGCVSCGDFEVNEYFFDFSKYGIVCRKCNIKNSLLEELSASALLALRYIIYSDIRRLHSFKINDQVRDQLNKIIPRYMNICLEKKYTKLDYFERLVDFAKD